MGIYDNGNEFDKHLVWPCLSWSYFLVFYSQARKGNGFKVIG